MSALVGILGIIGSLYFVFTHHSTSFTGFFDLPAIIMLIFLPPSIMLLSHTLDDFWTGIRVLLASLFNTTERRRRHVIDALTSCSAKVRTNGVTALVEERPHLKYDLLQDGVSLIINNFSHEEIRYNLDSKMVAKQKELSLAHNLFENMSRLCPGVGMIGTLIGLVMMMSQLSDPKAIGGGMAMALITTLYGLLLGTIFYAPFAEKIAIESEKMQQLDALVFDGVLALKGKKSSLHFKDILKTYGAVPGSRGGREPTRGGTGNSNNNGRRPPRSEG